MQALVQRLTSPDSPDLRLSPSPRTARRPRGCLAASPSSATLQTSTSADWQPSPSNLGKERNPKEEAEPPRTWLEDGVESVQILDGGKRRREVGWREPGGADGGVGGVDREGALTPQTPFPEFFERGVALPARPGPGREDLSRQGGASGERSEWGALPRGREDAETDVGMRESAPGSGPPRDRAPPQNRPSQIPQSRNAPEDAGSGRSTPRLAQVLSSRDGIPLAKGKRSIEAQTGGSEIMFGTSMGLGTRMEGGKMERENFGSMRGRTRPTPLSIAQGNAHPWLLPKVLGRSSEGLRDAELRGEEAVRQERGSPLSLVQNTALTLGSPGNAGGTPRGLGNAVWRREGLGVITPSPSYMGRGGGGGDHHVRPGGGQSLPESERVHTEDTRTLEETSREEGEEGDDSGKPPLLDLFL